MNQQTKNLQDAQEVATKDLSVTQRQFLMAFGHLANRVHQSAREKGFWESDRNNGEMIALIHSELGEMTEGLRHGNPPDDHIPAFSSAEAEAADVVIRLMDLCVARGWRLPEAIIAKMEYNAKRPYKHGKLF